VKDKGTGKVVPVLFSAEHHAMKAYWEMEVQIHAFLTSILDGDASRPGGFTHRESTPVTQRIGGWVGPRAGLNAGARRKISCRYQDSNPRSSSP